MIRLDDMLCKRGLVLLLYMKNELSRCLDLLFVQLLYSRSLLHVVVAIDVNITA